MGKPSGLRRRGAVWYFRKRCPKHLLRPGVPPEIWISLGTTNYQEALGKLDEARQAANDRFREPVTKGPTRILCRTVRLQRADDDDLPHLTRAHAATLARSFFRRALLDMDAEPPQRPNLTTEQQFDVRAELQDRQQALLGWGNEDQDDLILGPEITVLKNAGFRCDPASEPRALLREYLRRAMVQLGALRLARLDGDYSDRIVDNLFQPTVADTMFSDPAGPPISTTSGTMLDTILVDRWAKERSVSPKGVDKHRAAARWFYERVGSKGVEAITKADVLTFKNRMIEEGVTAANANAKLSCLRTLLGYAVENALLDVNPADRINVLDKDKDRRKRKEFDLASLHRLFSSPVYVADERPRQGRGEAAYWLPLIGLYTGARLEEIAQLRPKDVRQERYIDGEDEEQTAWIICIVQEDDLSTKNAISERRVPVHQELERLGFIRFAEKAQAAGSKLLFPDLRPNKYGKLGAKWGEWWSRYRRETCGITDRRIVFHSFRHTFKSCSRHVGMIEGVQRQIMGHSPGDTADEYGMSRYSLHQLVEGMKAYRVPGLKLPPPPPAYR